MIIMWKLRWSSQRYYGRLQHEHTDNSDPYLEYLPAFILHMIQLLTIMIYNLTICDVDVEY